jgi:hypothetical protein
MKKIAIYVTIAAVLVSINPSKAFGVEESTLKAEAGITPDSILYPIDKVIDNLKVAASFSDEAKVETLVTVAEERLGESEAMTQEGKTDLVDEAIKGYNDNMEEASEIFETVLENKGTSTDEKTTEKLEELEKTIQDKQMKSLEVLTNLQSKLGDKAKEVIARVIEMQTAKKEAVKAMVEERHRLNALRESMNEAKGALQKAKEAGDAAAIEATQAAFDDSEKSYETAKETMKKVFEEKKAASQGGIEKVKEAKEQAKEQIQQHSVAGTITEEKIKEKIETPSQSNKKIEEKKVENKAVPQEIKGVTQGENKSEQSTDKNNGQPDGKERNSEGKGNKR